METTKLSDAGNSEQTSDNHGSANGIAPVPPKLSRFKFLMIGGGVLVLAIALIVLFLARPPQGPKAPNNSGFPDGTTVSGTPTATLTTTPAAVDPDNPPQIVQANFMSLDHIYSISKFRSGAGHDFSDHKVEFCRSMKHYFNVQMTQELWDYKLEHNGANKPFSLDDSVPIYSPVDGTISELMQEDNQTGDTLIIRSEAYPTVYFRIGHTHILAGVTQGMHVTAGQQLANVGGEQGGEIIVEVDTGAEGMRSYISYFAVMPDSVFALYQARGVQNRDELIITKEYRDAHPLECNPGTDQFAKSYDRDADTFVRLSGYVPFNP